LSYHEYLIVGAGPAGLQMGYFLEQAGREYLILEAAPSAGAFFAEQPRHRTLISLNKCYNWFDEPDFNLRYDWNSLLTHDHSLLFPAYTKELYPHADTMVQYLNDFARKYALKIQYNTLIQQITREGTDDRHFALTDTAGNAYHGRCLLIATGAIKPNIPADIEGIELAEGYETHNIDPERFINKRVVILGRGNSAFEVANHLAGYAATIQIFTAGQLVVHAWQTHFVGDLRSINDSILEMNQLKMPHLISGARVTKIVQQEDGTLKLYYDEDVPHWAVPGTMRSVGVYDHVIRCTGWKFVEPALFGPSVAPAVDARSKYAVLSAIWESSVPDLFFIGGAMANNDRKTTPGFIHGFRYNIRTLFHLLEQRYHDVPLPTQTFPLDTVEDLQALVEALLTRISTTSALFQMFGVLGDALVLSPGQAEWFRELPVAHVLTQPRFTAGRELVMVTLELGFDRFPAGTDTLSFIHPNDPGGDGQCVAFIHPVVRHYSNGQMVNEVHMQSGVFVRYDQPNETFALEFNSEKPKNLMMNFINSVARVSDRIFTIKTFTDGEVGGFTPWPPERRYEDPGLPKCLRTHSSDFVPDPAKYL